MIVGSHRRSGSQLHRTLVLMTAVVLWSPVVLAHDGHQNGKEEAAEESRLMTTRTSNQVLKMPLEEDVFQFVIYGDRTGGVPEGLKVLEQAVVDTNLLDPDLVMTVGDLIQGYNETAEWLPQMKQYKQIMSNLKMPWYPVAGNHDVYWRGKGPAPPGQHDATYEQHFGPLWYSFAHKNAAFIVLYSDEGDPRQNIKSFSNGWYQRMSDEQLRFLEQSLDRHHSADHVFVFLHHPRWIMPKYVGGNWEAVHTLLKNAGNVSAVFAGHIHHMHYAGKKDGIQYHTLATTGGLLSADIPGAGFLHHMNMVSVRPDRISVSAIPVGAVMDPKEFTEEFLQQVSLARQIRATTPSNGLQLAVDGSASGELTFELKKPSDHRIVATVAVEAGPRWKMVPDHRHTELKPGGNESFTVRFDRSAGDVESLKLPRMITALQLVGQKSRIQLPEATNPIPVKLSKVPADYFAGAMDQCLSVTGLGTEARVENRDLNLPDGPMTVEAWLRQRGRSGHVGAIAKTEGSEYAIFIDEGVPQFDLNLGGRYFSAKAKDVLPTGQWTHVAGVFDGNMVKIFVDGVLAGAKSAKGKRRKNRLPLLIGADVDGRGNPTRSFDGDIDEVRLSKSAIYDDHFTPRRRLSPHQETVLMLHFDRRIGPFVLDQSTQAAQASLAPKAKLILSND